MIHLVLKTDPKIGNHRFWGGAQSLSLQPGSHNPAKRPAPQKVSRLPKEAQSRRPRLPPLQQPRPASEAISPLPRLTKMKANPIPPQKFTAWPCPIQTPVAMTPQKRSPREGATCCVRSDFGDAKPCDIARRINARLGLPTLSSAD